MEAKHCFKLRWKKIKNNGNIRRKRRILVNNIISPRLNESKLCEIENVTETMADSNVEVSDQVNFELNFENNIMVETENENSKVCEEYQNNWEIELEESNFPEHSSEIIEDRRMNFLADLKQWGATFGVKLNSLNGLLKVINENVADLNLPKDARTVMVTPREKINILEHDSGDLYCHYGISKALKNCLNNIQEDMSIKININVDGLPLFRSSKMEFWPILMNIYRMEHIQPMVVGIYSGNGKPKDMNWFMSSFVNEFNSIWANGGVMINEKKVSLRISCFICDTPARTSLKGVIGFNGYFGCLKCETKGIYSYRANTMIYPELNAPRRTDEKFRNGLYTKHCKFESIVMKLPINMVEDFPIADSLHLLDLGITKRLLTGWKKGDLNNHHAKWSFSQIQQVTAFLEKCKLPKESVRQMRSLSDMPHWKGTEYRHFLLYPGIVVVDKFFSDSKITQHFLLYFCGIVICLRKDQCEENYNVAEAMLEDFLINFKALYGIDHFSSNLHNLSPLVEDVRKFGPLDSISAYPFESKLFHIKRMIRDGNLPLSQISRRISELQETSIVQKMTSKEIYEFKLKKEMKNFDESDYPLLSFLKAQNAKLYTEIELKTFMLSAESDANKWFLTKSFQIVCVKYIIATSISKTKVFLYGSKLSNISDYFTYPVQSSQLNIYESDCREKPPTFFSLSEIFCKMVKVEYNENRFVFIPLIHTIEPK